VQIPTEESVGWVWRRAQWRTNSTDGKARDEAEAHQMKRFQAFLDDVGKRAVEAHEAARKPERWGYKCVKVASCVGAQGTALTALYRERFDARAARYEAKKGEEYPYMFNGETIYKSKWDKR
jgi:hypothetical protein